MTPEIPTNTAPTADEVRRSVTLPRKHRRLVIAAVLGVAGAAVAAFVISNGEPAPTEWALRDVDRGDIVSTASATGNLQPRTTVTVGSEISGLIKSVEVADSETVTAGQVLATFDETDLGAQLALAKASLSSSNATVRRSQASYDEAVAEEKRTQQLVDRGVTPRASLDAARSATVRAKADLDKSRADAQRSKATVVDVETMRGKAEIRSPISGVILERNVEPGQTVASSLQAPELFVVAEDLSRMNLQIWIDEADVGVVQPGQEAKFEVSAWPNRRFDALVESIDISPTITDNVVTYMALLSVDNTDHLLRPGMTAAATITTKTNADVLRVPNAALRFNPDAAKPAAGPAFSIVPQMGRGFGGGRQRGGGDEGGSRGGRGKVHVERAGQLEVVEVRTGATDGNFTEILEGELKPGDRVVVGIGAEPTAGPTKGRRGQR